MPTGFDTPRNVASLVGAIAGAGNDFVGRYLSQSTWKVVDATEASAIAAAGIALVLLYEDGPTAATYFSFGRGQSDGLRAAQQACLLGAPADTAIYFAVDYDASSTDISGPISQYFTGVLGSLKSYATSGNPTYVAGVYGSGATCSGITGAGLASFGWLAQSTGWSGYDSYLGWTIKQGASTVQLGISVDPDNAVEIYGGIPGAPPGGGPIASSDGSVTG
jgi:hypothetical protein